MASRLSDDELRRALRDLGEEVGPVTPTTRATYERRLSSLRRAPLNALSSDDSEIESPPSTSRKQKTRRDGDVFKKPVAVNVPVRRPTRRSRKNSRGPFEVDTSDSEAPSDSPRLIRRPLGTLSAPHLEHNFRRPVLPSYDATPTNSHRFPSTPTLERLKKAAALSHSPSNGFLPPEEAGPKGEGRSTEYSHCISWLLLAGTLAFFLLIGLLYMSELHKTTPTAHNPKFCDDVPEDQCKPLILVSRELHYLLTQVAGDYECGSAPQRNVSERDAQAALRDLVGADDNFKMEQFDEIFDQSLSLFQKNPTWGVKRGVEDEEVVLEAEVGRKSVWCRARLALHLTLTRILIVAAVLVACGGVYGGVLLWRRRREAQEKLFYEMVEQVIDVLREPCPDPQGTNCRPVVNVRDALIPPQDRRSKGWLWDRVVQFIEVNESRVSVEFRKINGEDFKVWRWNTPPTPHNNANAQGDGAKQGKVWQGQAFSSPVGGRGRSAPFNPTPCLKIRNMFDPEVEYGDEWQTSVKDAILEKCEGNDGIIHIAFDSTTNNEGCVYMMCSSTDAAGQAYGDLHGWWFDGKLVTVKYLKKSRYLERFPSAPVPPSPPLRPSNDRRASLSAPFFSSALERS